MIPPDEAARARAEHKLAVAMDIISGDPEYWYDLDLNEDDVARLNSWASEHPEQTKDFYLMEWPRWLQFANNYAYEVMLGLAERFLQPDSPRPALKSIARFRRECFAVVDHLWAEHFQGLCMLWDGTHREGWQQRLPGIPIPAMDREHFETGFTTWRAGDWSTPQELPETLVAKFWQERSKINGDTGEMVNRAGESEPSLAPQASRLSPMIESKEAARKLELFLRRGTGQTEFATKIGTTDRTLRSFRKTGKIRRDIFDAIARGMGLSREDLLGR
jgi:hypothetical protein